VRTAGSLLLAGTLAGAACATWTNAARGDGPPKIEAPTDKLDPERYELAGFPIVGGNSDIGLQFGGAATLTRFHDAVKPYLWNLDLLLSAAIKNDTNGIRLTQQSHVLRLDAPDVWGGRLRLDGRGSFQRTINQGYYGLGNASSAVLPQGQTDPTRRFQYIQQEGRGRLISRVHTGTVVDVALGANLRFESPDTYGGSKLTDDIAAGGVRGASQMGLAGIAAGIFIDTRDSEFVTRRGVFYQIGVSATAGTGEGVGYGEASAVLAHYAPLPGPFIFASRVVASAQVGNVPFYDMLQAGVFEPQYVLGGETGVRGVPNGRYGGRVKFISNTEIRATPFPRFHILGQRFLIGTTTFFDWGRVWNDFTVNTALDGTTLGLKYGVGGGLFLQWGEAAIFRIEAAYSPDAVAENPSLPVGIYVSDGAMF
jgi:hypothetical protein